MPSLTMDIPLVHLIITVENCGGEMRPHELFSLRKSFPLAFRRATGCLGPAGSCGAGPECPCRSALEQKLTPDPAALRRYQKPPLPFAFRIPVLPAGFRGGSCTEISLTLVGEATNRLDLYLAAIGFLFSPAPQGSLMMLCRKIEAVAPDGSRIQIQDGRGAVDISSVPLLGFSVQSPALSRGTGNVTLELVTPLRLLHQGVPLRELPFHALAGSLFRRISSLAYYYGGVELSHDFKWLAQQSRLIDCSRSELRWANHGGGLQGVEGRVSYCGELDEFVPFLELGGMLNTGKGAAYGMGAYRIVFR